VPLDDLLTDSQADADTVVLELEIPRLFSFFGGNM
jgi:hypothetical protein